MIRLKDFRLQIFIEHFLNFRDEFSHIFVRGGLRRPQSFTTLAKRGNPGRPIFWGSSLEAAPRQSFYSFVGPQNQNSVLIFNDVGMDFPHLDRKNEIAQPTIFSIELTNERDNRAKKNEGANDQNQNFIISCQ